MTTRPHSPVWHPFTQHALRPSLPKIVRAEGAYLFAENGQRILDAISSWWVITHGHCHPRIVDAIKAQAAALDQVIFAEYTHAPAEQVAARLTRLAPKELEHVFFSDSGSTSVEVALKMALGFWRHNGEPRHRIIVLEHSYHGDTIGTMSVGARGLFTDPYDALLFDVERIPFPAAGREEITLTALEQLCRRGDAAALLVEPLVLGAGGMLMYSPAVLAELRRICTDHGVLFIADEVMTGWGRTGSMFACEQAQVSPDIACYSKGLTGGALPLAVTLCRREIFQAHYATDRRRTFFHSSSFTANPIACAAALASMDIWESEPVRTRVAALSALQARMLERFRDDRRFENVRQTGTITAMDLKSSDAGYLAQVGPRLQHHFREAHVLLRPLGNTIYVLPPYCVTADDLNVVYAAIEAAAAAAAG
ncbi:MAG TPA: adenosylmethionine--8-amino-7-oxononanoate transaminase [Steroidobacteraceae bacterium]|jgi:adenosylmethionine-8-amino-7-oxononanoate aminotransferase|nr:adenosylmethionine--8-amino-7-oxononanoate transaminase [Steroidobacteraceae bacterium]